MLLAQGHLRVAGGLGVLLGLSRSWAAACVEEMETTVVIEMAEK
ncbi:hypothetical protein [Nitrospira sp. Kam-Ns4a]